MTIEFNCGSCSSKLRVPEQHAGKKAKCPKCAGVNKVPTQSTNVGLEEGSDFGVASSSSSAIASTSAANPFSAGSAMSKPQSSYASSSRMLVLKKVDILSAAITAGVIYAVIGLMVGLIFGLIALMGGLASGGSEMLGAGLGGVMAAIIMPIVYGLMGFVGGAIMAMLFNLASRFSGGLKFET